MSIIVSDMQIASSFVIPTLMSEESKFRYVWVLHTTTIADAH